MSKGNQKFGCYLEKHSFLENLNCKIGKATVKCKCGKREDLFFKKPGVEWGGIYRELKNTELDLIFRGYSHELVATSIAKCMPFKKCSPVSCGEFFKIFNDYKGNCFNKSCSNLMKVCTIAKYGFINQWAEHFIERNRLFTIENGICTECR